MALRQRALMGEERLKAIQEENELERQKLQEAIVEYKEQSKQHSLTIVALEDRLLEAKQQQKTLEEENAALVGKMEGSRGLRGSSLYQEPSRLMCNGSRDGVVHWPRWKALCEMLV